MCVSRNWKVLRIIFFILVALLTTWFMRSLNDNFESIITPKSVCLSVFNIITCHEILIFSYIIFSNFHVFTFVWVEF